MGAHHCETEELKPLADCRIVARSVSWVRWRRMKVEDGVTIEVLGYGGKRILVAGAGGTLVDLSLHQKSVGRHGFKIDCAALGSVTC